tara:strand:+ start:1013 stop:1726 length:714 start_codon:yes stop_codon:yes gene_type:complete
MVMSDPFTKAKGLFLSLEGGEGTGKSSLSRTLGKKLTGLGLEVTICREPGGTVLGERLRDALFDNADQDKRDDTFNSPDARTELLVFSAARSQLIAEVIQPALDVGKIVICDRYVDSTFAYQHYGRGLSYDLIDKAVNLTTNGLMPSITYLLDLDPREGLRRHGIEDQMNLFGDSERIGGNNYLDFESLDFHDRVRSGYLEMAAKDEDRWMVLDANMTPDELTRLAFDRVTFYLRSK